MLYFPLAKAGREHLQPLLSPVEKELCLFNDELMEHIEQMGLLLDKINGFSGFHPSKTDLQEVSFMAFLLQAEQKRILNRRSPSYDEHS